MEKTSGNYKLYKLVLTGGKCFPTTFVQALRLYRFYLESHVVDNYFNMIFLQARAVGRPPGKPGYARSSKTWDGR